MLANILVKMFELKNHPSFPAIEILRDRFLTANYKIYLVGGCVRDILLKRTPKDFDFATDATPEQMQKLFTKTHDIGKAFGTIQIQIEEESFEVTTFRKDLGYKDGRHPEGVAFTDAKEDALRRDFTMNALFLDLSSFQIIDFVTGKKDIDAKIIRFIGSAEERIQEDKLRLLRALRFAASLGFDLDPETQNAVKKFAAEISQVSRERIHDEMTKMIGGDYFHRAIPYLRESRLLEILYDDKLDLSRLKDFLDLSRKDFSRLQIAFALSNSQLFLVLFFGFLLKTDNFDWREWRWSKELYGSVLLFRLLVKRIRQKLSKAEILQALNSLEGNLIYLIRDSLKWDATSLSVATSYFGENLPFEKPLQEPLVSGADLLELGFSQGPLMGEVLEKVYAYQLENEITNKEELLRKARSMFLKS